jgi:hypothetical protein
MVIVRLQGRDYQKDNSLVWQLLRSLILETAAWNYVKRFDVGDARWTLSFPCFPDEGGRRSCCRCTTRSSGRNHPNGKVNWKEQMLFNQQLH